MMAKTNHLGARFKLKPPGAADRPEANLLLACYGGLGVAVRTIRLALDHRHFYRRAAPHRGLQHELLALRGRDTRHLAGHSLATLAPATLKRALPAIDKPGVLVVRGLVADDRPGPPRGVEHPLQPERDTFGPRLLVNLDHGDGMHGNLEFEYEGLAREGLGRRLLLSQRDYRPLVEGTS